ncbi:HlyD family efflux transporter periplasmic adaptor subunit [Treponema medium]|uniref:efflux RND transporter periplasmic adaptor subunit n=1 Tax=Treponema medium TaxID=58231 RepID=UPI0019805F5D|nr:HlyD family efflux transporter periplasmic adaptor subunit [Treponema medium]
MSINKKPLTTRQRKSRKTKIIVIVCIAALVGAWYVFMKPKSTKTGDLPPLMVKKEIEHNQIEVSGYIEAAQTQILEAPGEGFIEQVLVKEGDRVKKGTLLFALDTDKQSYAVAEHAFAIKREQINGASQKLSLMEQEQRLLEKQLADRKVYAKFDGIVAAFTVSQGQYARAKDSFGTLIDRSFLKATVEIAESDASRLAVGQKVDMTFPAEPDIKVQAEVISYPAIARLTSLGRTVVDTLIRLDNPPEKILPGYSFNGTIVTGADSEALIVEQDAIRYVEGKPFVDKIDGNTTQEIAVTVEPYIKGFVKILSGVQENDVLKNQAKLNNGRDF